MTDNKMQRRKDDNGKLSTRMSIFAWVICALLGWAFALTSINVFTSNNNNDVTITAENSPTTEDAEKMENILPAAGKNQ